MVSSRYRRRVPITSRTKPFKKGVSPTLQIRQEYQEAERNREKDYQKRREQLRKRIDARVKQLEQYRSNLVEVKPTSKVVSRQEAKNNIKKNKEEVRRKKTYVDESGKKVKEDQKTKETMDKAVVSLPPKKVFSNPDTWVKIDMDGDRSTANDKWKLEDIKNTMKLFVKQGKAVTADPSEIKDTTGGQNVYKYSGKTLWEGVTVIYDEDSKDIWAKQEIEKPKQVEYTKKELANYAVSEDGFAEDF
jgi:hypothetical protein